MPDMPGPNETRLNLIDGVEYITLRADDFRTTMRVSDAMHEAEMVTLRAENERHQAEFREQIVEEHTENARLRQRWATEEHNVQVLKDGIEQAQAENERLRARVAALNILKDVVETFVAHHENGSTTIARTRTSTSYANVWDGLFGSMKTVLASIDEASYD